MVSSRLKIRLQTAVYAANCGTDRFSSRFDSPVNFLAGVYYQKTDLRLKQAFALAPELVNGAFVN